MTKPLKGTCIWYTFEKGTNKLIKTRMSHELTKVLYELKDECKDNSHFLSLKPEISKIYNIDKSYNDSVLCFEELDNKTEPNAIIIVNTHIIHVIGEPLIVYNPPFDSYPDSVGIMNYAINKKLHEEKQNSD